MLTLSTVTFFGVLETLIALLAGVGGLAFYNHRLSRRVASLTSLASGLEGRLRALLGERAAPAAETATPDPSPEQSPEQWLDAEIAAGAATLTAAGHEPGTPLTGDLAAAMLATALRVEALGLERQHLSDPETDRDAALAARLQPLLTTDPDELPLAPHLAEVRNALNSLAANPGRRSLELDVDFKLLVEQVSSLNVLVAGFPVQLEFPAATHQPNPAVELARLKDLTDEQRAMVEALVAQKQDAETEVSVKVEQLKRFEEHLAHSEVCVKLMEGELDSSASEVDVLRHKAEDLQLQLVEMQALFARVPEESKELLVCIETLEQENAALRAERSESDSEAEDKTGTSDDVPVDNSLQAPTDEADLPS